jgi:hypothetical protein
MIELDALSLHIRYTWLGRRVGDRQLDPGTREVRLACAQGWYWTLLGLGMGWVRPGMAPLLRTSPPLLSDVQPRLMGDFIVPDDTLGAEGARPVWHRYPGGCMVDLERSWAPRVTRRGRELPWSELVKSGLLREDADRVLLELGPDLELSFSVGGLVFSSRLVGAAQPMEPTELDPHDAPWLGALTAMGALATVLAVWVLWGAGPHGAPTLSAEQVHSAIFGR